MEKDRNTLHPKTGETATDYHCREFSEFWQRNQLEKWGEDRTQWQDEDDFAVDKWNELEDYRECNDNPFQLINYSAGVWLGRAHCEDEDAYPVLPGLENLPLVPDNLNLWDFYDRFASPDAHADGAEECLAAFASAIRTDVDDVEPTYDTKEALLAFMRVACPAYTAVLAAWNTHLSGEEFWNYWEETMLDTFSNFYTA